MIKFENVYYGGFKNVSFELNGGSVCKVLLRSNGDRAAFLSLLTGVNVPDSGKVFIAESDIGALPEKEKYKMLKSLAIASAELTFISNLSIIENITLPVKYHQGVKLKEIENRLVVFYEVLGLDKEGLRGYVLRLPSTLSSEEKQITALLRALLNNCRIIVYDSVFAGLSVDLMKRMLTLTMDYHFRMPGRVSLYISTQEHTLKDIPDCTAFKQTDEGFVKWTS
ncbi:ATP-binding cassette domain-containing protein [Candidatus Magnetomonas plexicatena]|uniref:ATP-binding cassette domain-containing protein n=1 Tax=Candidatus Magnetomonas plexicatena TaxID=2552947 RepID=UPI001C744D30|nr:ATP-binding cassette domain-containing protein [Nitrospirales bacterium LBB_01]